MLQFYMKTINTETFIANAKRMHGTLYDYSKVTFTTSKTKVPIICPVHGEFFQTPNNHLSGFGCFKCGRITSTKKQQHPTSSFITKAQKIHKDTYDYSKVAYVNSKTPVTIICKIHGNFLQTPSNHLRKEHPQGCPTCGVLSSIMSRTGTLEDFKALAATIHNDAYDYSQTTYINYHTKLTITCPVHGEFAQTPAHHINGAGCPSCAQYGFNKTRPGMLYYLSINDGQAYKIGITNRTVDDRFSLQDLQKIEVILVKEFPLGQTAYEVEQSILSLCKEYKYSGPNLLASGNSELFSTNILPHIQELLDGLIQ